MAGPSEREVRILPDAAAIARRGAELFVQAAKDAVKKSDAFTVALAGGSTPKTLYSLLADDPGLRAQLPWEKIHFFFGDERQPFARNVLHIEMGQEGSRRGMRRCACNHLRQVQDRRRKRRIAVWTERAFPAPWRFSMATR